MAASPQWKVYDAEGEYRAATKCVEDAACLVAFLGDGATIKWAHRHVVWTEGREAQPAGESYDVVAQTVQARVDAILAPHVAADERVARARGGQ